MPETPLITPDLVEDLIVHTLRTRHAEHLAKYERARGLAEQTIERFQTVSHMASEGAERISGDTLPACLVGIIGTTGAPIQNADDKLDIAYTLAMQVTVLGQRRRDTLRRRDVLAWTAIECVLQRPTRNGPLASVRLADYATVEERDETRILADARIVFTITVADALTVIGGLPPDDTPWPAGGPSGAPPDGEPYTPPLAAPTATQVTYRVDKEPIVE